jgi:hypothetical protein
MQVPKGSSVVWVNTRSYFILPEWNVGAGIGKPWTCIAEAQVIDLLSYYC